MARDTARFDRSMAPQRVLVLLVPGVHLLDLAGPVQTFFEANGFGARYDLAYVGARPEVRSAQGLALAGLAPPPPDAGAGDLVLVPGMDSRGLDRLRSVPYDWLRAAADRGARVASICSGAFVLARAGLLDGRRCTTHWKLVERLQREAPRSEVLPARLYVEDRGVVTSAGVAAGIDLALALVERDQGPLVAGRTAREMVVYVRRAGEGRQTSVFLEYRAHIDPGVHRVQDWLIAHPEEQPSLESLAGVAAMSPRNLTRAFRRATGISVMQFVSRIKLQVARDLLQQTDLPLDDIARASGFGDVRTLRRHWTTALGTGPAAWRRAARA